MSESKIRPGILRLKRHEILHIFLAIIFVATISGVLTLSPKQASAIPIPPCQKQDICPAYYNQGAFDPAKDASNLPKFDLIMVNLNPITNQGGPSILNYINDSQILLFYEPYSVKLNGAHPINDWNTINTNENWFLHWPEGGNRITEQPPFTNLYWMDWSIPNFINYQIDRYVNLLPKNNPWFSWSKFDGYFADEVGSYNGWVLYGLGNPPPNNIPLTEAQWTQNHINFLQQAKAALGNTALIINGANTTLNSYVDGSMLEGFAIGGNPAYPFPPETYWKQQIDTLLSSTYNDKWSWALNEPLDDPTKKYFNFSFASYLLSKNPNAYSFFTFEKPGGVIDYYPEYDLILGPPQGNYYVQNIGGLNGVNLYIRDFQFAKVVVSVSPNSATYNLSQPYKKLDGTIVNSLTFNGQEGIILLNTNQCGNGIADPGEGCGSCPQDTPLCGGGTICCSDSCTTPSCTNDNQCNDNNSQTTDTCSNSGTCTATCVFTPLGQPPPPPTCGNGAIDSGENCSTCVQDSPCGGNTICCGTNCTTPVCTNNTQCNDNNAQTTDTCNNAGTCIATCVFTPAGQPPPPPSPTCGNGQVDSGETCTTCQQDIPPLCNNNLECNDNNSKTTDICNNSGTCSASCTHALITSQPRCGNNILETGENCSNCQKDAPCGTDQICENGNCVMPPPPPQNMQIVIPNYVIKDSVFKIKVLSENNDPIAGVTVIYGDNKKETNEKGITEFTFTENILRITAERAGFINTSSTLQNIKSSYIKLIGEKVSGAFVFDDPIIIIITILIGAMFFVRFR